MCNFLVKKYNGRCSKENCLRIISLFTIHYSLFTIHYSLFTIHYSLFTIRILKLTMKAAWYKKKWIIICSHIIAWLIVFSLPYLLRQAYLSRNPTKDIDENGFFYLSLITDVLWMGLFYLNAFILIPKLAFRRKFIVYGVLLMVIYSVIILIHCAFFNQLIISRKAIFLLSAVVNSPAFLLTVAVSSVYQMVRYQLKADALLQQKQQENLKTELSFLRSQISPHFIFNVLNNIVALARLKSDQLEPTVIKLSSLMQYMLYDANEEMVPLQTEIQYLESYIDLQKQRFGKKVSINIDMEISEKPYKMEPMLLIPFVENAFKHGVGMIENPQIDLQLCIQENTLYFKVRNKYNNTIKETKDNVSGIGLANVKRRLNLLYGQQHELFIKEKHDWVDGKQEAWFEISLQLKLH